MPQLPFGLAAVFALAVAAMPCVAAGETAAPSGAHRLLYAVDEAPDTRGSISVYDIAAGHRLIKTIPTVPGVRDVRGVAASARTGALYVAYTDAAGAGMIYCLDLYSDKLRWNRAVSPGVDRLAIAPDGKLLYVPTSEEHDADHINIVDAETGAILREVRFSNHSHDTQYPLSGPVFQTTKARDGSGNYLYEIDPTSYAVARIGPYAGVLGPYAVDGASRRVVNNVTGLWGMQVADLTTGRIVTAELPQPQPPDLFLLHGIGWTPDQSEVWQNSTASDPRVFVWDMRDPMSPVLRHTLTLRSGHGSHWLTFAVPGDYAYVAPWKSGADGTEIFDARTHRSLGVIGASEDMLEVDFANGEITQIGDQYGIGRR